MAADERRSTQMKTECLSALIGIHRRPMILFASPGTVLELFV
jgi:hypothetical protein